MAVEILEYNEARERIEDGDIIFVSSKSFLGWFVRTFTFSNYTHVAIAFWAMVGARRRLFLVEAQGGSRRRIVNMSFYNKDKIDVITAPIDWNVYADKATSSLGKVRYGWLDAIYVGIRESLMRTTKFIRLPRYTLTGEICSEFVARMLELPEKQVSPQLLYEQLEKDGHTLKFKVRPN